MKKFGGTLASLLQYIRFSITGTHGKHELDFASLQSRRHCGGIVFLFRERAGGRREQGSACLPFLPSALPVKKKEERPLTKSRPFQSGLQFHRVFWRRADRWGLLLAETGSSSKQGRAWHKSDLGGRNFV